MVAELDADAKRLEKQMRLAATITLIFMAFARLNKASRLVAAALAAHTLRRRRGAFYGGGLQSAGGRCENQQNQRYVDALQPALPRPRQNGLLLVAHASGRFNAATRRKLVPLMAWKIKRSAIPAQPTPRSKSRRIVGSQ